MGFVLLTLGMLAVIIGVLMLIGHFYQGSSADLVDWKPTRSPEVEAQNEIDDVRQMLEAQNEMRRRRGAAEIDERSCGPRSKRRSWSGSAATRPSFEGCPSVARALIVGCGCRGRLSSGSGCSPRAGRCAGRAGARRAWRRSRQAGIEPALADPADPGTVLDLVGDVAAVYWLLGSARGTRPRSSRRSTGRGLSVSSSGWSKPPCGASSTRRRAASTRSCSRAARRQSKARDWRAVRTRR